MPQLFRPPRPLPAPLEPSPPLDPASMPSPPPPPPAPAPPLAAEEDEERPWPPMKKMSLVLSCFVNRVFGGMDRGWCIAMIGIHSLICIVKILSFSVDREVALFWIPIFRVGVFLCFAAMVVSACVDFSCDPPQLEAAAAVQLPPPPPEMDMC